MIRILLIGPLPPPMGGNTRHFLTLAEDLGGHDSFSLTLINTSRGQEHSRRLRNLLVALRTAVSFVANLWHVDVVSYHASNRGMLLFAPFIVAMSRLAGRPIVLRVFGGSFGDFFLTQGKIKRGIIRRLILSADVVLLQTRRAIRQLQEEATGGLEWFSTYVRTTGRKPHQTTDFDRTGKKVCRKFIFLGHITRAKGLETILEAAPHLPDGTGIDLYGPLDEYTVDEIRERGIGRVQYCGLLTHEQVDARLWEYDCLILPTHYSGEGYPGAIAEAFAHELPVITTRWLAIPEIVDEECGILIEPRDTTAFVAAIEEFHRNKDRWLKAKFGARNKAAQFDHAFWAGKFEKICEGLVEQRDSGRASRQP